MKIIDCKTWEEAVNWIQKNAHGQRFLFRGQSNSEWPLTTTLERYTTRQVSLVEYYRMICIAKPQLETYTGKSWDTPSDSNYGEWVKKCQGDSIYFALEYPGYDLMIFLRHHGFPSPLLDWSRSPNVAAFFAFNKGFKDEDGSQVSIFVFNEMPRRVKSGSSGQPFIKVLGPYTKGHIRHFQQQSWYTVCTMLQSVNNTAPHYHPHKDIFDKGDDSQDALWKINIPVSERMKVLKHLNTYNLNAFSLFGSEDSLCEKIAFDLKIREEEDD